MNAEFEWDLSKATANLEKHGVSFAEAATVFFDPLSRTIQESLALTGRKPLRHYGVILSIPSSGCGACGPR
jgi:uncharacterized DUF497 family protein